MQQRMWLLALFFCAVTEAATPLRVGLGVSDQVFKNPTAQSGYEQLLVNELMQTLQLPHQIIKVPHARLRQMLAAGELDLAVRQQQPGLSGVYLTSPYTQVRNKAFALADFRGQLQSTADLANYRLTAFQNATAVLGPIFAEVTARSPEYRELTDHTQAVLMLLKGRTQLLVMNEKTLENVLTGLGRTRNELREFDLFAVTEFRLGSRDAALAHELDQLLNLWQQNGRLQLLRQRGQELRYAKRPQPQPATVRNE
ncbi:transporter substrate-binding domain-containing protein [Rheinheimera texasensis]|uniref:substrate-binding periplasmic protein n=1 Tax=Rheinheimera texasensis TaxID=306205 RepID=UPI0032B25BAE